MAFISIFLGICLIPAYCVPCGGACVIKRGHAHSDNNSQIIAAIQNIDFQFDEHVCHSLIRADCSNYVLLNDEVICATDGITYNNHCEYAKAKCTRILDKHNYLNHTLLNPLGVVSPGPCHSTTTSTATVGTTKTIPASPSSTNTGQDGTTTSVDNVMKSIFCKNVLSINCGQDFSIVCGSDGQYYPNECELLKWQCEKPTLTKASDASTCG